MPEATEAILKSTYMDDYIESVDDEKTAMKLLKQVSEIHSRGGFQIRNWMSNKQTVLECTPKDTLSDTALRIKTGGDELSERTLGLLWFPSSDTFGFDLSLKRIPPEILNLERKPTKREFLRVIMSIFDIFGFLAPFTVKAKIILQNIWKSGAEWEDEIPEQENKIFKDWIMDLQRIQQLRIPRYHFHPASCDRDRAYNAMHNETASASETSLELHVFCDAAPTAYSAVAYYRLSINKKVNVSFIACKCRAAPINKCITIPKLELQAAVIACRLADTIARDNRLKINKKYFWTDSLVVLHQIRNETRNYKVFVANRLGEIDDLSHPHEWNYIPTSLNIADKATKLNTYQLTNDCEWFKGPRFLYTPREEWPQLELNNNKPDDEILQVNITTTTGSESIDLPVPDTTKFSSWIRLLRCTANVLVFIEKCRTSRDFELNADFMQRAEIILLRYSQLKSFSDEIHMLKNNKIIDCNSRLRKLTPMLDDTSLLRAHGRIDATSHVSLDLKRPIILDGRESIARLLTKHYHEKFAHGCNETVVNEMRQKYWLLNLRPTVRAIASKCLICRIRKAKPVNPRLGDLPEARVAHHQRPFSHCGVDLFGPMEVSIGRSRGKRYGVLFTCLTIRAIHIELVPSLSADSFIMALRRMAARRGWPYRMHSDNGTNFRGADAELKRSFAEIKQSSEIKDELINRGLSWHFISPVSPHMGGAWERLIKSVKTSLKIILKNRAPREEVLTTLITEVENIINSRPLSYVSVDNDYPESLTPNHFLLGSSSNLPVPGEFSDDDMFRRKSWRIAQRLTDMFWRRWIREVLPTMVPRQKWHQDTENLKKGDVVVIVDPSLPRNTWPKGLIQDVHPGADGRVRVVDVKTRTGVLTRPVTRVALLPTAENDCSEEQSGGRM